MNKPLAICECGKPYIKEKRLDLRVFWIPSCNCYKKEGAFWPKNMKIEYTGTQKIYKNN